MSTRGRLITFEGIDGSGKTTQIDRLEAALREHGIDVLRTREPGGTPLGEKIRSMLLQDAMTPDTETLLFFAARAEHVATVIKPALEAGIWVLSDRFTDATYAYQVGGKGVDAARCEALEAWTLQGFAPDKTVLFDIPPAQAAKRRALRAGEGDRFERESEAFFSAVRSAYLTRAKADPNRFLILDATRALDEITASMLKGFESWF